MRLTLQDLDGFKLVDETNVAPLDATQMALEHAFQQGSQGWGVSREVGVYLSLARDLKLALALANTADEAQRMLKGAQMELGRVKKAKKKEEALAEERDAELVAARAAVFQELVAERLLVKALEEQLEEAEVRADEAEGLLKVRQDRLDSAP
jgi:hypothetical protein